MRIYIIAAYSAAPRVRALHARLRDLGHEPTSSWAEHAHGPEPIGGYSESGAILEANTAALESSDGAIILADTPMREGWCEVARLAEQRVCVVGPSNLTTRAHGWDHVATDADALAWAHGYAPCPVCGRARECGYHVGEDRR